MGWFGSSCDTADLCEAVDPRAPPPLSRLLVSLSPFILTFVLVALVARRSIFPRLARDRGSAAASALDHDEHFLPSHAPAALRQAHAAHAARTQTARRAVAGLAFATTVALAAVLAELILAEVAEAVDPAAKRVALRVVVPTLLFELVALIPFLEMMSLVAGAGWSFRRTSKGRLPRGAWMIQAALFAGWLLVFWRLGGAVPLEAVVEDKDKAGAGEREGETYSEGRGPGYGDATDLLTRACLERIGVIGIALMALLSGFASISSPWHTFGPGSTGRRRPVTESDVSRKQAGLDATAEMLAAKRHRLQALERRAAEAQSRTTGAGGGAGGFVGKMLGSIRGLSGEEAEMRALRLEISGLETMEANLGSTVAMMRGRQASDARAGTALGRVLAVPSYLFALYCVYRVLATVLTTLRRLSSPTATFSSSDPINRLLGLLARHWDPKLDQLAWARQISFLLSGVMLAASANSALQTFHLFAKWMPGLLYQAQANLALLTGQIAATYVISAAMLLRSSLPREVGGRAVGDALQSALGVGGFVDRWFEAWFLLAAAATALGIWVGGRFGGDGSWDEWDDYAGEEMGAKRS